MSITSTAKYRTWSYQLSIAAGIMILFSAATLSQWHLSLSSDLTWMAGPVRLLSSDLESLTTALIICGIFVTASGVIMLKWRPTKMLGIFVILFSVLSLTEMGGFFFGSIMGIIGGIFAFKASNGKHGLCC